MPNITVYSDKKPIVSLRNKKETIEWEFTVNTYKVCRPNSIGDHILEWLQNKPKAIKNVYLVLCMQFFGYGVE